MFIQARSRKSTSDFKWENLIELKDLFYCFLFFLLMQNLYKQEKQIQ